MNTSLKTNRHPEALASAAPQFARDTTAARERHLAKIREIDAAEQEQCNKVGECHSLRAKLGEAQVYAAHLQELMAVDLPFMAASVAEHYAGYRRNQDTFSHRNYIENANELARATALRPHLEKLIAEKLAEVTALETALQKKVTEYGLIMG